MHTHTKPNLKAPQALVHAALRCKKSWWSCLSHKAHTSCSPHSHPELLRQLSTGRILLRLIRIQVESLDLGWASTVTPTASLGRVVPLKSFFLQQHSQEEQWESCRTRAGQKHLDKTFLHWNVLAYCNVLWRQFDCSRTLPRNCQTCCLAILCLPMFLSSCLGHEQQLKSLQNLQAPGPHSQLHEELSFHGWPGFWLEDRAARGVAWSQCSQELPGPGRQGSRLQVQAPHLCKRSVDWRRSVPWVRSMSKQNQISKCQILGVEPDLLLSLNPASASAVLVPGHRSSSSSRPQGKVYGPNRKKLPPVSVSWRNDSPPRQAQRQTLDKKCRKAVHQLHA